MDNDNNIVFLSEACKSCFLKPDKIYSVSDIWELFGADWDLKYNELPTLNIEKLTKLAICLALKRHDYCQLEASKEVGISPRQINYLIKKYKIKHRNFHTFLPKRNEDDIQDIIEKGELYEWLEIE